MFLAFLCHKLDRLVVVLIELIIASAGGVPGNVQKALLKWISLAWKLTFYILFLQLILRNLGLTLLDLVLFAARRFAFSNSRNACKLYFIPESQNLFSVIRNFFSP